MSTRQWLIEFADIAQVHDVCNFDVFAIVVEYYTLVENMP